MPHSRGHLDFEPLFTTEELGLAEHANIDHIVKVFLAIGDGIAMRRIEMPHSLLLLQSIADDPASGAIYVYDRERKAFYVAIFEHGREDSLTTNEFEELVEEYDMLSLIESRRNLATLYAAGNA